MNDAPATRAISGTSSTQDSAPASRPAGPCAVVIFGASGDLTQRKLAGVSLSRRALAPPHL